MYEVFNAVVKNLIKNNNNNNNKQQANKTTNKTKKTNFIFNTLIHDAYTSGLILPCNAFLLSYNNIFKHFLSLHRDLQKMPIAARSSHSNAKYFTRNQI